MPTTESEGGARSGPSIRRFDLIAAIVVSLTVGFSVGRVFERRGLGVADQFQVLYYNDAEVRESPRWLGTPIEKIPFDTWTYQEILYETRPDVILEMGTFKGGSALYFASIFDLLGHGRVITVDVEKYPNLPQHPRIAYLLGSSTSDAIVSQIKSMIGPGERIMAVLDSDHRKAHVLKELEIYSQLVTAGQYLVAEDTNTNGHPVDPGWGDPGPFDAVRDFLAANHDYKPDRSREKFKVTFFPGGWLKRIR